MKLRFFPFLALIALAAAGALAHGNKKHVVGTLEKINADSVVVKTADGKSVEVKLAAATAYVSRIDKADKPAKVSDLAVGDRVVIHATPKGEILEADEIKFSPASAAHTAAPAAKKPSS
jgi:preprotein translocase subunit YajC